MKGIMKMKVSPKVKLIEHTPNPEMLIAMAAKLCYSSSDIEELMNDLTPEKVDKFLNMLFNLGHESPIEHATFTFAIEGISRVSSHQLVRHRIASYSQKSQRYVDEGGFDYVIPPSIEKHAYLRVKFESMMHQLQEDYDYIRACLADEIAIDEGIDKKAAEKRANEDARFVLPNACETKIIVTMNIRSLFNFFKHRCCNRAQWEIREVAMEMWRLCMDVAPSIFIHSGPDCITKGKCSEGKMSCGHKPDMTFIHVDLTHSEDDKETE